MAEVTVVNRRHDGKATYWTHPEAVDACFTMQARYHVRHRIYPCHSGDEGSHWHATTKVYWPRYAQEDYADAA